MKKRRNIYICTYICTLGKKKEEDGVVTHDVWHVICDTLQVGGVEPSLKTLAP